jgi:Zn-dependent peptidase ImmA (M78 family)
MGLCAPPRAAGCGLFRLIAAPRLPILALVASQYHYRGAKRARQAREDLGAGQFGPLDDLLATVEGAGAHVLILELPDDVGGAYIKRPDMPLLFVCGSDWVTRQRFTIAHEFGHFRMGHESVVDRQASISGYSHDPCEVEANAFAAEFLVPKRALEGWARRRPRRTKITLEDVVMLAWEYGVSPQAMRYRLNTCEVLRDRPLCERLDAEIADGLHIELFHQLGLEPVADSLATEREHQPRIPAVLRDSLFGDLLAGEIDAAEMARKLDGELEDVQRMLAAFGLDQLLPARRA